MPQNTKISVGESYTLLTDADVTAISFQNQGSYALEVVAVASGTPAETVPGVRYAPGQGEDNLTLANRWLGVTSPARVWARFTDGLAGSVWVSHA